MLTITPLSSFDREYAIGLRQCDTLARPREFMLHWGGLCHDAWQVVTRMDEADWDAFRKGLRKESRGQYAGDAWAESFGAVLMPALLLRVSMVADEFKAPWGVAFLQLETAGCIRRNGNIYEWVDPPTQ